MQTLNRVALLGVVLILSACGSLSPFSAAKSTEQKAFAAYGTFVIVEEQAAKLVGDPTVPTSVKRALQRVDAKAKPAADELKKAADQVVLVKRDLNASADKKKAVAENLSKWYEAAKPSISCLAKIVSGGDISCSN